MSTPHQHVNAQMPLLVFACGQLLPRQCVRVEASPLDPTVCKVIILVDHPELSPLLAELLPALADQIQSGKKIPMDTVRCLAAIPAQTGPIMIEAMIRELGFARRAPEQVTQ